jgi:hypothetical protein
MRRILIFIFLLTPFIARSQEIVPDTYGINGTVVSDQAQVAPVTGIADAGNSARLATAVFSSAYGAGALTSVSLSSRGATSMQFTTGFIGLTGGQSNIAGMGLNGSMIPLYAGLRHELARVTGENVSMAWYAAAGAGPVLGIEYGGDFGFLQQFRSMGFRWGGGAYAGSGVEVAFTGLMAMRAQLEYDGLGFLSPLAGRSTYLGPSFCLGFQFAL